MHFVKDSREKPHLKPRAVLDVDSTKPAIKLTSNKAVGKREDESQAKSMTIAIREPMFVESASNCSEIFAGWVCNFGQERVAIYFTWDQSHDNVIVWWLTDFR